MVELFPWVLGFWVRTDVGFPRGIAAMAAKNRWRASTRILIGDDGDDLPESVLGPSADRNPVRVKVRCPPVRDILSRHDERPEWD